MSKKILQVQNVKLFLWHHLCSLVPFFSVWSSAARVLINYYLGAAALTSTTFWNELCSSLWELEQWLLSRSTTISSACVRGRKGRDSEGERVLFYFQPHIWLNPQAFFFFLNNTMVFKSVPLVCGKKNIPRPESLINLSRALREPWSHGVSKSRTRSEQDLRISTFLVRSMFKL